MVMSKDKFLTVNWNNLLTLGLGIPLLIFVVYAFSSSVWTERGGLIWLAIIGVIYWIVIEFHTSMRFAWLKENTDNEALVKQESLHPLTLIRKAYNAVFWIFLLPFVTSVEYRTGFILFTFVIFIRLVLNLVTNNFLNLSPDQYERFPFRIT